MRETVNYSSRVLNYSACHYCMEEMSYLICVTLFS